MENYNEQSLQYLRAKKKVKKVKGFYIHALVFILVNLFLLVLKLQKSDEVEIHDFGAMVFWGIGLIAHGLSVFMPNFFLGKDWEERKIKELMDKDKR